MKDLVRPRNEDPGQRSRDRQHWHDEDASDKQQRKKFWIHIVFDILLVAAAVGIARYCFTMPLQDEVTKLQNKVTKLEKQLSVRKVD